MSDRFYQIQSSYFAAGIAISKHGIVTEAAPIVAYMVGWMERRVVNYCNNRAWRIVPAKRPQKQETNAS